MSPWHVIPFSVRSQNTTEKENQILTKLLIALPVETRFAHYPRDLASFLSWGRNSLVMRKAIKAHGHRLYNFVGGVVILTSHCSTKATAKSLDVPSIKYSLAAQFRHSHSPSAHLQLYLGAVVSADILLYRSIVVDDFSLVGVLL
jgi:hypothetical protein